MTTDDGKAAADAIAQKAAAALAAYQKFMSLVAPLAPATPTPAPAPPIPTPPPAPVLTNFAWAKAQMQAGHQMSRADPSWAGKTVFLGVSGNELMRLPQGFPFGGAVVPWLYGPGDTDATDWQVVV